MGCGLTGDSGAVAMLRAVVVQECGIANASVRPMAVLLVKETPKKVPSVMTRLAQVSISDVPGF